MAKSVRAQAWCGDSSEIVKRLASGDPVAIKSVGRCGPEALPGLEKALQDKRPAVQVSALEVLAGLGAEASETLPEIVEILKAPPDPSLVQPSVRVVEAIAEGALAQAYDLEKGEREEIAKLGEVSGQIEEAIAEIAKVQPQVEPEMARRIELDRRSLQKQLQALESGILYRVGDWVGKNPLVLIPVVYVVIYLACFAIYPRGLLKWDEPVAKLIEKLPGDKGLKSGISAIVTIFSFLRYHPRVLDAWVASHLKRARERFDRKTTVEDRAIYLPVVPIACSGVQSGEKAQPEFTPASLQPHFEQKRNRLLIWGEGGAGKTSLACQIGKWAMSVEKDKRPCRQFPMLPVLVEQELSPASPEDLKKGKHPFVEAVRGQLTDLIGGENPPSAELLERLLRKRRILVIVDRFSEMGEETRRQIRPESPEFPANATIVTSRLCEKLGEEIVTCLKPERIEGDRIASFVNDYLRAKDKRHILADDDDYFDVCKRLSRMVDRRPVTVLLAKLYADELIAARDENAARGEKLPENVPDLMQRYVQNLNRADADDWKTPEVLRDAQAVAWHCLQPGYVPGRAKQADAIATLTTIDAAKDAESRLQHLEKRLGLVQTLGPSDKIKFVLDPLSEYLAALFVMERCGNDLESWQIFLAELDKPEIDLEKAKGFVLALRDCCEVDKEARVPEEVQTELAKKGGLTPEDIENRQRQRRIATAIRDLQEPEDRPRLEFALARIAAWGEEAKKAVPVLGELAENPKLAVETEEKVVKALGAIRTDAAIAILRTVVEDGVRGKRTRIFAAVALQQMGVQLPIPEEFIAPEMVQIPGGKFWMGSAEGEGGDEERPQHEVEIKPFQIGKYPVTQAEWREVATLLPQVKRELKPDPSEFKGDDRPVEQISWYEAVEFCDRLTHFTGREYRLPTEAEWEYSCRAGTTTAYHFGPEITPELANSGGNKQGTTPVGSYGANAFGLYDMHGNVWEWCADRWHKNYEGAPTDGSAWLEGSKEAYLLRGGSWYVNPRYCRSAGRNRNVPGLRNLNIGFRVVCVAPRTG